MARRERTAADFFATWTPSQTHKRRPVIMRGGRVRRRKRVAVEIGVDADRADLRNPRKNASNCQRGGGEGRQHGKTRRWTTVIWSMLPANKLVELCAAAAAGLAAIALTETCSNRIRRAWLMTCAKGDGNDMLRTRSAHVRRKLWLTWKLRMVTCTPASTASCRAALRMARRAAIGPLQPGTTTTEAAGRLLGRCGTNDALTCADETARVCQTRAIEEKRGGVKRRVRVCVCG